MYTYCDWFEAGYQFGRLRENWNSTPCRLFISESNKIKVDNLFRLLYGKFFNKIFDCDQLEDFFSQLANISQIIDTIIAHLPDGEDNAGQQ